jgi:hypothetical protein
MLRQIERLTRAVPGLAPGALAVAIYAEARDDGFVLRAAAETGFEGVACVDDVARAALLYTALWQRSRSPRARATAEGYFHFLFAMQEPDGGFVNFILNWDGEQNRTGPTSSPGGWAWTVRGLHALARGAAVLGSAECAARFERGLPLLDQPIPYLDLRAVAVLAALELWRATAAPGLRTRAIAWAEEIAAARLGDVLPDRAGRAEVHLWGHLQETALARAGRALARPDLVDAARRSADTLLVPAAERAFAGPRSLPFDVTCTVIGLQAVAEATGDARYAEAAALARAWFDGRNAAGQPVYDRQRGLVHDGIDDGRLNQNSGAEANIEGALALLDALPNRLESPQRCR